MEKVKFGQCRTCRSIRWLSDAAAKEFGTCCLKCGDKLYRPIRKLSIIQRFQVFSWMCWEHDRANYKGFSRNPFNAIKILKMSWSPQLEVI